MTRTRTPRSRAPSRVTGSRYRHPNRYAQPLVAEGVAYPAATTPRELRSLWERTYQVSFDYYTQERGPDPISALASNCAWKAVLIKYTPQGVGASWAYHMASQDTPTVARFGQWRPRPSDVAGLERDLSTPIRFGQRTTFRSGPVVGEFGRMLEFSYLDHNADFRVARFSEPGLPEFLWDDDQKCVLALPGLDLPAICAPIPSRSVSERLRGLVGGGDHLQRGVALVEKFQQRPANCFYDTPDFSTAMSCVGTMDAVVYRSDKWGGHEAPVFADHPRNPDPELRGSREYLHQDQFGVVLEQSRDKVPGTSVPAVSVVRGARLDAYKEGLVY